ncbi:MAG: 2,3-bisphosphoglycerate-independent phosphoglycerate mutase, partial [Bacteroidota bacterium]
MKKKAILVILDGWGIGDGSAADAVAQTATPCFDRLLATNPHSTLVTYGEDVGLPEGQMGNSEVGHLNIGAGRVVYQDLVRINRAIADQSIDQNPVLVEAFQYAAEKGVAVHLMGLLSDGGVHSSQHHLHHLCDMADAHQLDRVYVHAFTDGRDTDPKGGVQYLQQLEQHLQGKSAHLASVIGRYYAMDRDNRWERVREAYDLLVHGKGTAAEDLVAAVAASYEDGVTDEFIRPVVRVDASGKPIACIQPDDVVICFNFRTDRCREITMALTQQPFPEHAMAPLPLHYVTFTNYDQNFRDVQVVFTKDNLQQTLGETLAQRGRTQVRIAETEKYPHVTFFFSGGREAPFEGESRLLIHSPKVATYDLQPEMSAPEITAKIVARLHEQTADFV